MCLFIHIIYCAFVCKFDVLYWTLIVKSRTLPFVSPQICVNSYPVICTSSLYTPKEP